ncbi:MAG: glycosyltransferase [Flavihumibacter sp.]
MKHFINPADTAFIFISSKAWYSSLGGTAKSLARELGKTYKTYYINYPLDRISVWRQKTEETAAHHIQQVKAGKQLQQVEKGLFQYYPSVVLESVNWLPATSLFNVFNRINNKRLAREIRQLIKQQGIKRFILVNDKDIFRGYYLKEMLKPELYVYLDRDYLLGTPYWAKHGHTLEPKLMASADLVLCNSIPFVETAKKYNPDTAFVGNGCDIQLFNGDASLPMPADLSGLQRPVIGYAGALVDFRLDLQLLETLAGTNPQWSFVLIGKEDKAFQASRLHQLPNVHFLGFRPLTDLPAYYTHFDVCINPQLVNEITDGNYPMKIDEYLAMGRPVVATDTRAMAYFAAHTYLASGADGFAQKIQEALDTETAEKAAGRIAFAGEHSWEAFTRLALELMEKKLNGMPLT